MIVDLDRQDLITLKQLEALLFVKEILFYLTVDSLIRTKLTKISLFLPYLYKYPTIKASIKVKEVTDFEAVFETVAVGGTFDHFHLGHQVLLLFTVLSASKRIYIGISGSELLAKKKSKEMLQPWSLRMKNVQAFVKTIKPQIQVICFLLKDPFGVTIEIQEIDALVLSEETVEGGKKINEVRASKKMRELKVMVCPTISPDNSIQKKLSSSFIREYLLSKNNLTIERYSEYKGYFDQLVHRMKMSDVEQVQSWWEQLFLNYSQHWRFYHCNQHILRLLQDWRGGLFRQRREKLSKQQLNIIQLTIFFHDALYRPDSKTNEQESAKLALQFLHRVLPQGKERKAVEQTVERLILQTKNHEPTCQLSQIIYDLDMGILDSELKSYKEYAKGIKKEYGPLMGQSYPQKRCQLLKKWKETKHYFSFEPKNMQQNLQWEIFCLQNNDL